MEIDTGDKDMSNIYFLPSRNSVFTGEVDPLTDSLLSAMVAALSMLTESLLSVLSVLHKKAI